MDYKYIEQLIARYFEAETSNAEEDILRSFFRQSSLPRHLEQYAPLFAYQSEAKTATPLDEEFDRRLRARLEAEGHMPAMHVKAINMTWNERLRPLWRSVAAVAVVVLVIGSARQTAVQTTQTSIVFGTEAHQNKPSESSLIHPEAPYRQAREHMKMAVTQDTLTTKDGQ